MEDLLQYAGWGVSSAERRVASALFPLMRGFATRRLAVTEANVDNGIRHIREILQRVETVLGDGRDYLCGDHFTAADLTFACMLSPLVLPPEYGIPLPAYGQAPPGIQPMVRETLDRPAGQYALKLFKTERPLPPRLHSPGH